MASLPPIPFRTPMLDRGGRLSPIWSQWFRQLYERLGGIAAPSTLDLTSLNSQVSANTSNLASLNTLEARVEALEQGRQL